MAKTDERQPNNARICAGMVVFNGDLERAAANADNIIRQVDGFFFVDNGSDDLSPLEERFASNEKVRFIRNGSNMGIAYALNRALDAAVEGGFDWLLTLDQDTVCDSGIISVYKLHTGEPDVGIISPYVINYGSKTVEQYKAEPLPETEEITDFGRCITSAALTDVRAARKIVVPMIIV